MIYIYDYEIHPNLFVAVFKQPGKKEHVVFVIWYHNGAYIIDDRSAFFKFIAQNPGLVGFNNIEFDAQLTDYMLKNPNFTVEELKVHANICIRSKWPVIPEWQLTTRELDLYRVWHFLRL